MSAAAILRAAFVDVPTGRVAPVLRELARVLRSDGKLIVGYCGENQSAQITKLSSVRLQDSAAVGGGETLALYRKKAATGDLKSRMPASERRQSAA